LHKRDTVTKDKLLPTDLYHSLVSVPCDIEVCHYWHSSDGLGHGLCPARTDCIFRFISQQYV